MSRRSSLCVCLAALALLPAPAAAAQDDWQRLMDGYAQEPGGAQEQAPEPDSQPAAEPATDPGAPEQQPGPLTLIPVEDAAPPALPRAPDPNLAIEPEPEQGPPARTTPPVFYDADAARPVGPPPGRPLRELSADTDPGSKIVVVKKDAPGDSPKARFAAAQRAMALGRYEAALGIYDDLAARTPKDAQILMGRAVALHRLGRFDEAIAAYERVLEVKPGTVEAEVNMLGLMAQRYPAVALQRLRKLHEKSPQRTDILAQIAVAHGKLANYDEALRALGMAAATEPTNAQHMYNMAVIADRTGRRTEAVQYYEKALEIDSIYSRGQALPRQEIYARLSQIR